MLRVSADAHASNLLLLCVPLRLDKPLETSARTVIGMCPPSGQTERTELRHVRRGTSAQVLQVSANSRHPRLGLEETRGEVEAALRCSMDAVAGVQHNLQVQK